MIQLHRFAVVSFCIALLAALSTCASAAAPAPAPDAKIVIALAGDSTVTDNAGWGKGFADRMTADVKVLNFARGGRSSKSFIREGSWKKVLDSHPDYVLIQFGHNDQPGHPGDRETDPATTYRQYMTQYVDDARAAGIKPVLVTSLSRRQWGPDGKIHSTLQPYAHAVKQIAAEKHVPLIDLHAKSIELYEKLGKAGCEDLSPLKDAKPKKSTKNDDETVADAPAPAAKVFDGTHLNAKGSALVGKIVADELKAAVPDLAPHIK